METSGSSSEEDEENASELAPASPCAPPRSPRAEGARFARLSAAAEISADDRNALELTTQEERDARIAQFADAHFEDISDLARVLTEAEFGFFPELRIYLNLVNLGSPWPGILLQLRHPIPGVRMPQHFEPQMRVRPRNV